MIKGLSPISRKDACLLILGSMPSERSIAKQQYYAHPQNAFWQIMSKLLGEAKSYRQKTGLLKKNRIALWDVIQTCERKGSLDSDIRDPKYNDLEKFLRKHPKIRHVLLNGGQAHRSYLRYAGTRPALSYTRLPSTSPANTMKFGSKLKAWKKIIQKRLGL